MTIDISNLLGKRTDEIEKPKPLPIGNYGWMIKGHEIVESSQKKTPGVRFQVQPFEAKDDVDEDLLAEVRDPFKKNMNLTFWITEDSLWRLNEFIQMLGLGGNGETLEELIPETTGQQFVAAVQHEQTQDGNDIIPRLNDRSVQAYE